MTAWEKMLKQSRTEGEGSLTCQDSGTSTGPNPVGETRAPKDVHIQERSTSHLGELSRV